MGLRAWAAVAIWTASASVTFGQTIDSSCLQPIPAPLQDQHADHRAQRREGSCNRRNAAFTAQARKGGIDLVFFGDSITDGWDETGKTYWDRYYGHRRAANFAISGDRTQHILYRIEDGNVDGMHPKVVIVMIGTNNLNDNPVNEIADGIALIVRRLRKKLPDSKILLLGIFPREEKPGELRTRLTRVNERIARLADHRHVFYLDLGRHFTEPDGTLSHDISPDSVHLSEKGYEIWARAMEPTLAELLKSLPTNTPPYPSIQNSKPGAVQD